MFNSKKIKALEWTISKLTARVDSLVEIYNGNIRISQERLNSVEKDVTIIKSGLMPALEMLTKVMFGQEDNEWENEVDETQVKRPMCKHCKIPMAKNGKTKRGIRFRCRKCWEFKYV